VINANDVAVMGVQPRWFLATVLLPEGTRESEVRALFRGMREALEAVGAALVGGHTEVTAAVRQPVVAGQMLGLEPGGHFVPTGGARPGDVLVQAGRAPIEGAAVLAIEASARLGALDPGLRQRAATALSEPGICVVEPALAASELGATALHDPTEGGLSAALFELADASGVSLRIDPGAVLWFEPGLAVCEALGADPWGTLASGALLASFDEADADAACAELTRRGFDARAIGRCEPGSGVRFEDGSRLARFSRDEVARVLAAA
jgi:hydrogenase maturation factor